MLIVKEAQAKHNFGGKGYLSFEHITWVKDLQNYTMIAVFRHIHWVSESVSQSLYYSLL